MGEGFKQSAAGTLPISRSLEPKAFALRQALLDL